MEKLVGFIGGFVFGIAFVAVAYLLDQWKDGKL